MWRDSLFGSVLSVVLVMVISGTASAQPVLDQEYDPTGMISLSSGISGNVDKAQTFTVGLSGILAQVDVFINDNIGPAVDDLVFDVRDTAMGTPLENDAVVLASAVIPAGTVPTTQGFFSIDVSAFGVVVSPGDVLAIVLRSPGDPGTDYGWFGQNTNPYPGGVHYFRNPGAGFPTWTPTDVNHDVGFRTFVCPAGGAPNFIRGDADGSGIFNGLVDGFFVLNAGFVLGSPQPTCLDAADADNNDAFNALVDAVFIFNAQFVMGSPLPPPPFPNCGPDNNNILGCVSHPCP